MTGNDTAAAGTILLAAVVVMAFLLPAPAADAQESVADALLACERVSITRDRVACLNDIVRRLNDIVRRLEAGEAAPIEDRARAPVADSGPAASKTSRPAVAAAKSIPEDFGLKEKPGPDGKFKKQAGPVLIAKVVRHWRNGVGRLVVQLDNDQIWTEVASHTARIPKGEATVEIRPGGFGGFRMRINNDVGLVRVKRLE